MKVDTKKQQRLFEPVTLSLTFETQEELNDTMDLFRYLMRDLIADQLSVRDNVLVANIFSSLNKFEATE